MVGSNEMRNKYLKAEWLTDWPIQPAVVLYSSVTTTTTINLVVVVVVFVLRACDKSSFAISMTT